MQPPGSQSAPAPAVALPPAPAPHMLHPPQPCETPDPAAPAPPPPSSMHKCKCTCAFSVAPKRCTNNTPLLQPAAAVLGSLPLSRAALRASRSPPPASSSLHHGLKSSARALEIPPPTAVLPYCHCWKYMLHHVRRRLHHAPCVAARAHPASLARIRYQKVLPALLTPRPRKAVRQNAAL